jgi:hypothetical protein
VSFGDINHNVSLSGALKHILLSRNNAASSNSRLHTSEMHHNVTKDYRKLLVNKLCHISLLPGGIMCSEGRSGKYEREASQSITAADKVHVNCVRTLTG